MTNQPRTIQIGKTYKATPCVVTIDAITLGLAHGECKTCRCKHVLSVEHYERGGGPWKLVDPKTEPVNNQPKGSQMRITTAWGWQETDDAPELISAYDELTEDAWNGTPDFFTDDIAKFDGETRICVIEVPSAQIYDLFKRPTIQGRVL